MSVGAKAKVQRCNRKAKAVKVEQKKYNIEKLRYICIMIRLLSVVVDSCSALRNCD